MIRRIAADIPEEVLKLDLERYRQRALELGATDAVVVPATSVVIDERVRAKCTVPKCRWYGTSANCPPHAIDVASARVIVGKYRYGLLLRCKVPSTEVAGANAREKRLSIRSTVKALEILSKLESQAFYDGYYLALGFSSGSCKHTFCPTEECAALLPGQPCRHPLRSRSSMEAVGMDVFRMAARVGWDIYPIGGSVSPEDVPCASKVGLLLID